MSNRSRILLSLSSLVAGGLLAPVAATAAAPAVVPVAVVAPAPAPVLWGPPGLCHPLDIGSAASLPFGKGAFELDESFDRLTTVAETLRLLDAGSESQVHMETLRRAVVYLTHDGGKFPEVAEVGRLVAGLEQRRDAAIAARKQAESGGGQGGASASPQPPAANPQMPASGGDTSFGNQMLVAVEPAPAFGGEHCAAVAAATAREALATFDFGYALGLLYESGHTPRGRDAALEQIERAVTARPSDGGMRLGASIVALTVGQQRRSYEHLRVALTSDDSSGLLKRNACQTMGKCLGKQSDGELLTAVDAALARA